MQAEAKLRGFRRKLSAASQVSGGCAAARKLVHPKIVGPSDDDKRNTFQA